MDALHLFWLAFIQGVTEFLPISSSAHLILPSEVLGWEDQGLAFDVAVHIGSLTAVVCYFRHDLLQLSLAWFKRVGGAEKTPESQLAWMIIYATLPVCVAGLVFNDFIEQHLRSISVIATTTIVFGLLLALADKSATHTKTMASLTLKPAMTIGFAQVLALIPGTSRSGITMTAALALGFDRVTAARFSFLLSIPVILSSGGFKAYQLLNVENVDWLALLFGSVVSAITAFLCIYLFLKWISRLGMMPFVWYRLALGCVLIALIWL